MVLGAEVALAATDEVEMPRAAVRVDHVGAAARLGDRGDALGVVNEDVVQRVELDLCGGGEVVGGRGIEEKTRKERVGAKIGKHCPGLRRQGPARMAS